MLFIKDLTDFKDFDPQNWMLITFMSLLLICCYKIWKLVLRCLSGFRTTVIPGGRSSEENMNLEKLGEAAEEAAGGVSGNDSLLSISFNFDEQNKVCGREKAQDEPIIPQVQIIDETKPPEASCSLEPVQQTNLKKTKISKTEIEPSLPTAKDFVSTYPAKAIQKKTAEAAKVEFDERKGDILSALSQAGYISLTLNKENIDDENDGMTEVKDKDEGDKKFMEQNVEVKE